MKGVLRGIRQKSVKFKCGQTARKLPIVFIRHTLHTPSVMIRENELWRNFQMLIDEVYDEILAPKRHRLEIFVTDFQV